MQVRLILKTALPRSQQHRLCHKLQTSNRDIEESVWSSGQPLSGDFSMTSHRRQSTEATAKKHDRLIIVGPLVSSNPITWMLRTMFLALTHTMSLLATLRHTAVRNLKILQYLLRFFFFQFKNCFCGWNRAQWVNTGQFFSNWARLYLVFTAPVIKISFI